MAASPAMAEAWRRESIRATKMPIFQSTPAAPLSFRVNFVNTFEATAGRRLSDASGGRRRQLGFTLLELLVVLAILGLLIGLVAPAALRQLGSAKEKIAHQSIERLTSVLDIYKLDVGTYPTTEQGLQALLCSPTASSIGAGRISRAKRSPEDPWATRSSTACRASGPGTITICTRWDRPASRGAPASDAEIDNN